MAGRGKRFRDAGYSQPKPMISIAGKPMIDWALKSLGGLTMPHRFIFIALEDDLKAGLETLLASRGEVVSIPSVTEGAVNTTLLAQHFIANNNPLVIANCDQYLDWDFQEFIGATSGFDCSVVVFESDNPHHSYVETKGNEVVKVKEKETISPLAVGGIYFYRSGLDYTVGAKKLIESNDRTNGEFYVSPVFNKLIELNKKITYFKIPKTNKHMLGTPEEVQDFLVRVEEGVRF
jgi:NDP-sugar pyrophosphorylase family protein